MWLPLWVTGALGLAESVSLPQHVIPTGSKSTEEGSKTKTGASADGVLGNWVTLGIPPCWAHAQCASWVRRNVHLYGEWCLNLGGPMLDWDESP